MATREAIIDALEFRRPAYVPWSIDLTIDCAHRLREYLDIANLSDFLDSHIEKVSCGGHFWEEVAPGKYRDVYGVIWDRSIDKDIGTPLEWPIKTPADLDRYEFPNADNPQWYTNIPQAFSGVTDRLTMYCVDFSLFERAWTLRGMENLLMDMIERPEFVDEFLDRIVEHDLQQIRHALGHNVDAVYFGDDYGMQNGLIMGARHWRRFIKPRLARMFGEVRRAGKYVVLHSCGRVSELFDDLVEIGLNLFNPFQPEVTDVFAKIPEYHGRLAFFGGMSIQKVLPFGTEQEVREMTRRLIEAGKQGGYVFAPSHAVPRDVPPENLVAMMEELEAQPGYCEKR